MLINRVFQRLKSEQMQCNILEIAFVYRIQCIFKTFECIQALIIFRGLKVENECEKRIVAVFDYPWRKCLL